jgi:hypothetical protein
MLRLKLLRVKGRCLNFEEEDIRMRKELRKLPFRNIVLLWTDECPVRRGTSCWVGSRRRREKAEAKLVDWAAWTHEDCNYIGSTKQARSKGRKCFAGS